MLRKLLICVLLCVFALKVDAATYYVSNTDGNADFSTISAVNAFSFTDGDDVYFKRGDTWDSNPRLIIDWSGVSSANRTIIGAYGSGDKPIFDAEYDDFPGNQNQGLVEISKSVSPYINWVTIENLDLRGSRGHVVTVAYGSHIDCTNLDIDEAFNAGIRYYSIDYGTISGCSVTDTGKKFDEPPADDWPASIAMVQETRYITIENNTVFDNRGEGIGLYRLVDDCIISGNVLYGNNRVSIYLSQAAGNTVKNNLVYGPTPGSSNDGIGINDETQFGYAYCENNKVYGNMIAGCKRGIYISSGHEEAVIKDTDVYNNTVVDCELNLYVQDDRENSQLKNNIFWCISQDCVQADVVTDTGMVFDYNLWSEDPDEEDAEGVNDPDWAAPLLTKTTWWGSGGLSVDDFALTSLSTAIDAGIDMGLPYNGDAPDIGALETDGECIFIPGPDACIDPECLCGVGEGDCDSDDECELGLICVHDVGEKYGWPPSRDVCERPKNFLPSINFLLLD